MITLKITEQNARRLYKTATPEFKTTLEDTLGREFFSLNVTDRIKSYEDACNELGIEPIDYDEMIEAGFTPDEIIYRKMKTVTKALNEDWTADWNDSSQYKYYPWFKMSSGGFVFVVTFCDFSIASAGSASRICFKSSELAKYAGEQFLPLYSDFIK